MGYINFTSITCGFFLIYMIFAMKNFYDIFYPVECSAQTNKKSSNCFYSIPEWQKKFTVNNFKYHCFTKFEPGPNSLSILNIFTLSYLHHFSIR